MFENIEKARHLLTSGSTRAAVDEFFKIISELKEKDNHQEASRVLLEICRAVENSSDSRVIISTMENMLVHLPTLKLENQKQFFEDLIKPIEKIIFILDSREKKYDLIIKIYEALINLAEKIKIDTKDYLIETGKAYGKWAAQLLTKSRIRTEEETEANGYLEKAKEYFEKVDLIEEYINTLCHISIEHFNNKNEIKGEAALDKAVNTLLKLTLSDEQNNRATEIVMNNYTTFIEFKIADILNPEIIITKPSIVKMENNPAIRIITHAHEICVTRKATPAITVLAKELSLIGLAIFEKALYREAIPYYDLAKDYFLEIDNKEETIEFGNNLISLGLQLYTDEKYPLGRDYFNIAIEIGKRVDRAFEIEVYDKQADLFLKYNKFQLAIEAYRAMIDPLTDLPESELRIDIPSKLRQLARERFSKNDFHYAELLYRLTADLFTELDQIELAADTLDSAWQPMFAARNLQTGIDLATKAAEAYIKAGKEEEASDVYYKLADQLLVEGHYDIALERMYLTAQTIPQELQEQRFKPLVQIATKYTEKCLKTNDTINARELWQAACSFNESLSRALIKRDIDVAVETIEEHIKNVRRFDNEDLNDVTMESARGSSRVLAEAGENERAARIMVSFATDFLRKNLTQFANPLMEESALEFQKANQPEEAARIICALASYHAEHKDYASSIKYYLMASINSNTTEKEKIYSIVSNNCFETFSNILLSGDIINAEKGFEVAIQIDASVNQEAAANKAYEVAKQFLYRQQYALALKYFKQAIDSYIVSNNDIAVTVGAETVERGRELYQNSLFSESNNLIELGITTLYRTGKKIQAAQTARIEGNKFITSTQPDLGLKFLNKAMEYYQELNDLGAIAEINSSMGDYYINQYKYDTGLEKIVEAGEIYLKIGQKKQLSKIINQLIETGHNVIEGKLVPDNFDLKAKEQESFKFFVEAEKFAVKINDLNLNSQILLREWDAYSRELMHESAMKGLEKSYNILIDLNQVSKISIFADEVAKYSTILISNNDLINATKYINYTLDVLEKVKLFEDAAGICIRTCEIFLKSKNFEVAVSWGLRGSDILTQVNKVDEAILFLEELVDQLMLQNSIENAILCYGKIAKILEQNGRMKEVEETALKVMAFGTANMKSNKTNAGLRLWEVALTIGAIVGEEFTGRLCSMEGQTFYEIKDYEKSIELFKESFSLFRRTGNKARLIHLGNTIFKIAEDLEKIKEYDIAFRMLPIAFEAMTVADELFVGTEKLITHAKNYIEIERVKEGHHLINAAIDALFSKNEVASGVEKCFVGAALLISYGKGTEGGRLIDKGMEKIAQITDEASIKHLATVCRNEGIILREKGRLEASHIILASGIGILRTINDLIGIGQISIDLGRTLIQRNEMNAAVEAFRNGVHLL
ncbi:MAG: hypothetical protein ACFFDW_13210, partial [Candidatus Thorarchaeota archaeon]